MKKNFLAATQDGRILQLPGMGFGGLGATDFQRSGLPAARFYEKDKEMSKIEIENLNLYYSEFQALKDINLGIAENQITAFIGPSGCGKSTLLKSINRMTDLVDGCRLEGKIWLKLGGGTAGQKAGLELAEEAEKIDILAKGTDVNFLRRNVGLVFQKPNPFPMSIYDNIAYGPRTHGLKKKGVLDELVETALQNAALWGEVKDKLKKSALELSGGQQQRLCIARALAVQPEVLLMDEPTSALDPISTSKIEDCVLELKEKYTIVMVTHNMQQAVRVSDSTVFFLLGQIIEAGETEQLFSRPKNKKTEDYITGRFG